MTQQWNSTSSNELIRKYVGKTHSTLENVKQAKQIEANYIKEHLQLNAESVVMDLGPGGGFIASYIAPCVKHLHCVDISQTFLDRSKEVLRDYENVSYHLIDYGKIDQGYKVDAIYCVAVMIHFNIYDIAIYLASLYDVLNDGGKLLFDFYDADHLDPTDSVFKRHLQCYKERPASLVTNINFNSKQAIINICRDIGFEVSEKKDGNQPFFLVTKV